MGKRPTGTLAKRPAPKCRHGHSIVRVLVVPVKGRRRLEWACQDAETGSVVSCP